MRVWSPHNSMLIPKIPEGTTFSKSWRRRRRRRERDKTKYFTRREKALHVHLTICISQRPRRNINIHSYPNLRGLRIRKPTTSCLCFCFKLDKVKNATNKRFQFKAPDGSTYHRWSNGVLSVHMTSHSNWKVDVKVIYMWFLWILFI